MQKDQLVHSQCWKRCIGYPDTLSKWQNIAEYSVFAKHLQNPCSSCCVASSLLVFHFLQEREQKRSAATNRGLFLHPAWSAQRVSKRRLTRRSGIPPPPFPLFPPLKKLHYFWFGSGAWLNAGCFFDFVDSTCGNFPCKYQNFKKS